MASSLSLIEFLCEQIQNAGNVTYKKMFGEYLIYLNYKPIFLVCDDILYIKILKETQELLTNSQQGYPYKGAKLHFIVDDVEDKEFLTTLAKILEKITPIPKPKKI